MKVAVALANPATLKIIEQALSRDPKIQVWWTASTLEETLEQCEKQTPDVLLIGIIIASARGRNLVERIMARSPCAIIIVTPDADRDAAGVFAAMSAGALDVAVVGGVSASQHDELSGALLRKIRQAAQLAGDPRYNRRSQPGSSEPVTLVAVGASAGGPATVAQLLGDLSPVLPLAVALMQHIDPQFAGSMASWLNGQTNLEVGVARGGERPTGGKVYVAGRDQHLVVSTDGTLGYSAEPRKAQYSPSIDVLLESVARNWKERSIGVILTGMGADGAIGLLRMREQGSRTIAQDRASSAIYGMPKAAVELGAATDVLPISAIGEFVNQLVRGRNSADSQINPGTL